MKRTVTFFLLLAAITLLTTSYSNGPFFGGAGNRTGSAGSSAGCDGTICHAANGGSASLSIALLQGGVPVTQYVPGVFYQIRLTLPISVSFRRNFGFQASVVKAADGVTQAGILNTNGRTDLSVHQDVLVQLVEHNKYIPAQPLGGGNYLATVTFGWQAPTAGSGSVRVFAVINAVDSSRDQNGDQPRAGFQDFREDPGNVGTGSYPAGAPLLLLPNPVSPATGALELRGLAVNNALNLAIVDVSGRIVWRRNNLVTTNGALRFAIEPLPPGTYTLLVAQQNRLQHLPMQVK